MEKRFAITRVVGNDEKLLKSFDETCKEEALAYGAEVAKNNTEGAINCLLAPFTDDGKMIGNTVRVFEVWD